MESESYSKKILTLPNLLTFFRLFLIIPILLAYLKYEYYILTLILVIISGLTDVIDGIIARKFNQRTELGRFLDPLADKLTQIAVMAMLCYKHVWIVIPVSLLIVKEVVSGIIGIVVVRKLGHMLDAKWHGKIATVCLYIMLGLHLLWKDIPPIATYISVGVCSTLILLSFILYLIRYYKLSKQLKQSETK